MSYDVRIERASPIPLAVIRRRASQRELSTVVPALCGEVWKVVKAHNVDRPGRHVAVYLDGAMNIEAALRSASCTPAITPNSAPRTTRSVCSASSAA